MLRLLLSILLLALSATAAPLQIRVATYNSSLNRPTSGQLAADLNVTTNAQAKKVAEILQRIHPDIVLVNEFDYDPANPALAAQRFHDNYLAVAQQTSLAPLNYPYRYAAPSNTGIPTGKTVVNEGDFDNNGAVVSSYAANASTATKNLYGNDCFGFGWFPGQYSFVVYSKFPIRTANLRSFQNFLWKNMPGPAYPLGYYSSAELSIFRLSSKNHVDLPIEVAPGQFVHLLASHPTPPAFDSTEDRNGRRNHDEIRLWADYINGASYLVDDAGNSGGLGSEERFVILGDMNADPIDGDSYLHAINQLRNDPRVNATPDPSSAGGKQAASQGGVNTTHKGDPAFDTADFFDGTSGGSGNLRVDHVLPSKIGFSVTGSGVFWPVSSDATASLITASDHRLVYLDLAVTPIVSKAVRQLASTVRGDDVIVTWNTQTGVSYTLQTSPDLTTWTDAPDLPVALDPAAQTATATDVGGAAGEKRFYRVVCTIEAPAQTAAPQRARARKKH